MGQRSSFFFMKKNGEACRDFDTRIVPLLRRSYIISYSLSSSYSVRGYSLHPLGSHPGFILMLWSHMLCFGSYCEASWLKIFAKHLRMYLGTISSVVLVFFFLFASSASSCDLLWVDQR